MNVLIACEYSGTVRDAFINAGHNAVSCDLLPTDANGQHYQGDVFDIIHDPALVGVDKWDMMIAFPPCTYLCSSGLHWNKRVPGRAEKTESALGFVHALMNAPIPMIAIENPVGCISTRIRKPEQYVHPWQFGHDASKKTGLWLKGLSRLEPTDVIIKDRYANQTPSGQNKLGPSADRWKIRSKTYQGIADAMAQQWG